MRSLGSESADFLLCNEDYNERRKSRRIEKGDEIEKGDGAIDEGKPREEAREKMTMKTMKQGRIHGISRSK